MGKTEKERKGEVEIIWCQGKEILRRRRPQKVIKKPECQLVHRAKTPAPA